MKNAVKLQITSIAMSSNWMILRLKRKIKHTFQIELVFSAKNGKMENFLSYLFHSCFNWNISGEFYYSLFILVFEKTC